MSQQDMEDVYRENVSYVYKYLLCLTRDVDLTEGLVQETFYQATKGIHHFRGECKISVWLCQIAKRLWYKELNQRKREFVPLESLEEIKDQDDLEEQYLLKCEKVELFRKLHQLGGKTREVMYLRLTGELSFSEIGDIMGESENWARVTFYRGKQTIVNSSKC